MSVTRIKNYPEISFIEETSFEELKEKMIYFLRWDKTTLHHF